MGRTSHSLEMGLRYQAGRPLFGVACSRCGLATVVPLEDEPKTEFAWQLIRDEVARGFDQEPCDPPRVVVEKGPSWRERRAAKRQQAIDEALAYWDQLERLQGNQG